VADVASAGTQRALVVDDLASNGTPHSCVWPYLLPPAAAYTPPRRVSRVHCPPARDVQRGGLTIVQPLDRLHL